MPHVSGLYLSCLSFTRMLLVRKISDPSTTKISSRLQELNLVF